jgi:hypothetical protein
MVSSFSFCRLKTKPHDGICKYAFILELAWSQTFFSHFNQCRPRKDRELLLHQGICWMIAKRENRADENMRTE